jgi:dipeptidyl-peptidase 4
VLTGAAVICVDNRGVPAPRGRLWRKSIYRQVGVLSSADQMAAAQKILLERPYLNPNKVAVWGWSGGGSMSLNLLFRYPDVYQTAISVAPVPDMRFYDTIYQVPLSPPLPPLIHPRQERYMGLPSQNEEGYQEGSPITHCHNMHRSQSLLVIHGTGDALSPPSIVIVTLHSPLVSCVFRR